MREKLPATIVLPTSRTPPSLPPTLVSTVSHRAAIIDIVKSFARDLCAAGKGTDGHDERVAKMEFRLFRLVARSLTVFYDIPDITLMDVCEHGCHLHVNYGMVLL